MAVAGVISLFKRHIRQGRILQGLNKGESRNALATDIRHAKTGAFLDKAPEMQLCAAEPQIQAQRGRWTQGDGAKKGIRIAHLRLVDEDSGGKNGSKSHVLVNGRGVPLSIVVTGANEHDSTQMDAVLFRKIKEPAKRTEGFKPRRWVVEACHSWMNNFRKLRVRYACLLLQSLLLIKLALFMDRLLSSRMWSN